MGFDTIEINLVLVVVPGGKQSQLLVLGLETGVWQQWIMIFLGLHWNFIWWVLFRGIGGSEAMCWQAWRWWGRVWGLWQNADTAVTREESCERVGAWSKLKSRVISMRSQPNCLLLSLSLLMLFLLLLLFLNFFLVKFARFMFYVLLPLYSVFPLTGSPSLAIFLVVLYCPSPSSTKIMFYVLWFVIFVTLSFIYYFD